MSVLFTCPTLLICNPSIYVALLDENDELKSRSGLFGACKSCSGLQSELAEKVGRNLFA